MNRKDRRARRAQERRARRTGDHPAFEAGQKAKGFPPEYYQQIEDAARLIVQWWQAQTVRPTLRWVQQKDDGVFVSADLDMGARYLADSPDAFRLLAWLDERTERRLSLNQATWALRICSAIPMPDGTYYGRETMRASKAQKAMETFVRDFGKEETRVPPSACGHCGKVNEGATGTESGQRARPGDLSICVQCLGINTFDADLRNVAVTDEQLAQAPPALRAQLEDMQAILRQARYQGKQKGPAVEA